MYNWVEAIIWRSHRTAQSNPNFLNTVLNGYESCVNMYNPETKLQSSQWKHATSPKPKKARLIRSNVRIMLTVMDMPHITIPSIRATTNKNLTRAVLKHMYNQTFWKVLPFLTPHLHSCCTASAVVHHVISRFSGITEKSGIRWRIAASPCIAMLKHLWVESSAILN